jgi:aminopeptidase N
VTAADLTAYAASDPVGGATVTATCSARQPAAAAKEAAWQAAITTGRFRLALAHATGFWVPGQEELTSSYRQRYFSQALPALGRHDARGAQRLARALYPVILADEATLAGTDAELGRRDEADPLHAILLEQRARLRQIIAARAASPPR